MTDLSDSAYLLDPASLRLPAPLEAAVVDSAEIPTELMDEKILAKRPDEAAALDEEPFPVGVLWSSSEASWGPWSVASEERQ